MSAKVIDIADHRDDMHPSEWCMFVSLAVAELEKTAKIHDQMPSADSKAKVLELISETEELLVSARRATNLSK